MSATRRTAALAAIVDSASTYIALALIVQLRDETLELRDIFPGELALLAEMRDEWRNSPTKQPIQKPFAFIDSHCSRFSTGEYR